MTRRQVTRRPFLRRWGPLFLAGPVLWAAYFSVVYLTAEAGCRLGFVDGSILGLPGVAAITVAATVVFGVAVAVLGLRALRSWSDPGATGGITEPGHYRRALGFAGSLLSAIFLFTILLMGIPALVLSPC